MYFNLIEPIPGEGRQAAHEWMGGPYAEHQWLWRFFPAERGSPRDFLFRRRDLDGGPKFYVVSARPPTAPVGAWRVQSREYSPQLPVGARLSFELRANPVVNRMIEQKRTRHDVVMDAKKRLLAERGLASWNEWTTDRRTAAGDADPPPALYDLVHETCADWLAQRAEKHGFAVDAPTLLVEAYEQHGAKKKAELRFSTVDFRGELTVTDAEKFSLALRKGIGPAKAFGCGLLLVRRPG